MNLGWNLLKLCASYCCFLDFFCLLLCGIFYICLLYSFELLINRKFPKLQRIKSKSNLFCLGNGFASINFWQTWKSTHPACQRRTPRTRQTRCRGGRRWCCLRRPRPWWRSQASCLHNNRDELLVQASYNKMLCSRKNYYYLRGESIIFTPLQIF